MAQRAEDLPLSSQTIFGQQSAEIIPLRSSYSESMLRRFVDRFSNFVLEPGALPEFLEFRKSSIYDGKGLPRGNKQPVIFVEGFLGPYPYLMPLGHTLKKSDFKPQRSGLGINLGLIARHERRVEKRIKEVSDEFGTKVKVIMHSLGGVVGKVAIHRQQDKVESVVALATPHRGHVFNLIHELYRFTDKDGSDLLMEPLPDHIEFTNIFSRTDGIVGRHATITNDPNATQIEVEGTHSGLAWNINAALNTVHALAP